MPDSLKTYIKSLVILIKTDQALQYLNDFVACISLEDC